MRNGMPPAAAMKAMRQVRADEQHREARQHGEAEIARDLPQQRPQFAAAEIARADENDRPDAGGREIEDHEPAPADAADAKRERRKIAHAVDEAEAQDEPDVEALEPGQRAVDTLAPMRLSRQHAQAEAPANPEIALVAGEAAEPGSDHEQRRVQQTFRCGERREQHKRLAFEEGPYEGDRIGPRAVRRKEVLNVQARSVPPAPPEGFCDQNMLYPKRRAQIRHSRKIGRASCRE